MTCKERLTMHTPEGACLIINATNEIDARQKLYDKFKLACNKLAELEDKLENGTLIDVPCKVGDKVYEITSRGSISTYKIKEIHIGEKNIWFEWHLIDGFYSNLYGFNKDKIGKTVFLTREEAEARLKELKENAD